MTEYKTFESAEEYLKEIKSMGVEFRLEISFFKNNTLYKLKELNFIDIYRTNIDKHLPTKCFYSELEAYKCLYDIAYSFTYLVDPHHAWYDKNEKKIILPSSSDVRLYYTEFQ